MLPGPRCKASRSQASSQREACRSAQRADISNPISRVTHTPGAEMPAANDKASAPIGVCCLPPVRARRSARSKHPAPKHPDGLPAGSPDQMPCAAVGRTPGAELPANNKTSTHHWERTLSVAPAHAHQGAWSQTPRAKTPSRAARRQPCSDAMCGREARIRRRASDPR